MYDLKNQPSLSIFSRAYWQLAAANLKNVRMLTFAALILAMRVAVKAFKITLAPGLSMTFDCYVNALGSVVYGPVMAVLVGALSDTLGCMLFPSASGPYFLPFILTEISSGFIFALFLWQRRIDIKKVLLCKFTVNLVCNIILTSVIMKWDYYYFYGVEKAEAYNIINLVRIGKNLVLFPLEALFIVIVLRAALRPLQTIGFKNVRFEAEKLELKHYLMIGMLALVSVALVLWYIFWGKDLISANNFKWL